MRGSPCHNWVPVDIMCVVKVISLCLQKRQEEDQLQGVNTGNKQVQTNKTLLGIYSTSKNSASTFWNHSKTGETRNVSDQNLYWYLIGEWTVMLYSHDRHLRLSVKWTWSSWLLTVIFDFGGYLSILNMVINGIELTQ